MTTCYHYSLSETGTCPDCHTVVTLTPTWNGWTEIGNLGRKYTDGTGEAPTFRAMIADALGIPIEAVELGDCQVQDSDHYDGRTVVTFYVVGANVPMTVKLHVMTRMDKEPRRVEYDVNPVTDGTAAE